MKQSARTKCHCLQSSLEVLKDIADAMWQLSANEQYKTLESHLTALEAKVEQLVLVLEDNLRKSCCWIV